MRAGTREEENELILNSIEHYFGHLGIETIKRISITRTDRLDDLLENHADDIRELHDLGKSLSYNSFGLQNKLTKRNAHAARDFLAFIFSHSKIAFSILNAAKNKITVSFLLSHEHSVAALFLSTRFAH